MPDGLTALQQVIDPETGLEYRWEDVVEFSDEIRHEIRERILTALRASSIIREASFLFGSTPQAVHLDDILPGGVWIRHLGTSHGKSVFRMTVRTRNQEQLELALNISLDLAPKAAQEEANWLIVCSEGRELGPLVEIFGGWWPEHQLWTEEFIPGETLDRALQRLERRQESPDRLTGWWPTMPSPMPATWKTCWMWRRPPTTALSKGTSGIPHF